MKTMLHALLALLGLGAAYLLLWPVPIEPAAWTPPAAPALEGPYAANDRLASVQRLAPGYGHGPEGLALDAAGNVFAGYADGRVVRFDADGANPVELLNTGGRPLGACVRGGGLWIADAWKGLLFLGPDNRVAAAITEADGVPFRFTDDVDVAGDGAVYFTDASSRFGIDATMADFLEHGGTGRLLRYDPATREVRTLLAGLHFPNGVAVGPDDAYVLVNETAEYRVLRYWLKGGKAGTAEPFIENLPGFPDNLSFNGRDRFWVALYAPRAADLDRLLPQPFLRKVVFRLPAFVQPKPVKHGFVLGLGLDGTVTANLQHVGADAYAPITSVEQFGDVLYLGSLTEPAMARFRLSPAP